MIKHLWGALLLLSIGSILYCTPVYANTVQIRPLKVQSSLQKSEKKKGFVDVTNPTSDTLTVGLSVAAFRQIDNEGNLKFYEDEQIEKGIKLDFESAILGPHQTLRLYYIADGAKLPQGDVFAVIFARVQPRERTGAQTTVRVGTLLVIENGTQGARAVEIAQLDIPFIQVGDAVRGYVSVKNPAPVGSTTGFFPRMRVVVTPWGGGESFTGPLVFAGNTRRIHFELPSNQFGFYTVTVTANDAVQTKLVFIATGWWRFVGPVLVLLVIGIVGIGIKYRYYYNELLPKQLRKAAKTHGSRYSK